MAAVELTFEFEKETPGTFRYRELVEDDEEPCVGTLYVRKFAAERLGNPETLTVIVSTS